MKLRRADHGDVPELLRIREELAYVGLPEPTRRGGFLLGNDADGYHQRMRDSDVWVIDDGRVQGFAIVLPDATFRRTSIWERRHAVSWDGTFPSDLDQHRLCYFDQLAVRRRGHQNRRWAAALALHAACTSLSSGHDHMITTTVAEPMLNLAVVPYLDYVGARRVGQLHEVYDGVGPLVSHVWWVARAVLEHRIATSPSRMALWIASAFAQTLPPHATL